MKNAGYEPIIRALAALPGTAEQVHQRMGGDVPLRTVVEILRDADRTGMAHLAGVEHVGVRRFERHYALGDGPAVPWPHASRDGGRSTAAAISLATLLESLATMGPMLVADLAEEVGMHRRTANKTLALLRRHGLARVAAWLPDAAGRPSPAWATGSGPDARKPRPKSRKVLNAISWARRRAKLHHQSLLAASAGQGFAGKVSGQGSGQQRGVA